MSSDSKIEWTEDTRLRGTPARHESDAAWRRVVGDRKLIVGGRA